MTGLKLARLPDRTQVKMVIQLPPGLHARLVDYAALYAEAYGVPETVQALVPAMLASFLEGDRGFAARRRQRPS